MEKINEIFSSGNLLLHSRIFNSSITVFTLTVMISSLVLSVDVRDSTLAVCPSNLAFSSETMD